MTTSRPARRAVIAARVALARAPSAVGLGPRDLVAGAPHGQDEARLGRVFLDLGPQPLDRHVDEPRVAQEVVAPHLVEQGLAGEDLAGSARERRQQPELGVPERDLRPSAADRVPGLVDLERSQAERAAIPAGNAPTQRDAQAGEKLGQLERLAHVIVGTGLQAGHHVDRVGPCRQHDDRHGRLGADHPADRQAIEPWKHHVQQDHVRGVSRKRRAPRARRPRSRPRTRLRPGRARSPPGSTDHPRRAARAASWVNSARLPHPEEALSTSTLIDARRDPARPPAPSETMPA